MGLVRLPLTPLFPIAFPPLNVLIGGLRAFRFPIAPQLSTDLPHSLDGTRGSLFLGEQLTTRAECTWSAAFLLFQYLPEGLEVPCGFLTQSLRDLSCPICKVSIHTTSTLIVSRLAIDAPRAHLG
jgi:hypothetical protein